MNIDDKLDLIEKYQLELKKLVKKSGSNLSAAKLIQSINNGVSPTRGAIFKAVNKSANIFTLSAYVHFLKLGLACNLDDEINSEYNQLMQKIEKKLKNIKNNT